MIEKRESTLKTIKSDIKNFYDKKRWHFLTLNGVMLDQNSIEIQWIFTQYNLKEDIEKEIKDKRPVVFYCQITKDDIVPDISDILPSAIISQREIVDMFGVSVQNSTKGLYLDEDSLQMPLFTCGVDIKKGKNG